MKGLAQSHNLISLSTTLDYNTAVESITAQCGRRIRLPDQNIYQRTWILLPVK